jgi:hypothetical protein
MEKMRKEELNQELEDLMDGQDNLKEGILKEIAEMIEEDIDDNQ